MEIITKIYNKWMTEAKASWIILTECFRACRLNNLAADIEKHLGIPSPQNTQRGAILLQSVYTPVIIYDDQMHTVHVECMHCSSLLNIHLHDLQRTCMCKTRMSVTVPFPSTLLQMPPTMAVSQQMQE